MMPRTGRKGKCPNKSEEYAPTKRDRKENLTKDDFPTIVEAVFNAMEDRGNTNRRSECPATCSRGRRVTSRRDDTGSRHARETSSSIANDSRDDTAKDTGDDTAGTTNQDVGEYNYVLSTVLNIIQAVPLPETKVFFVPLRIFRLTLFSKSSFAPRGFLPVRYS